MRKSLALVVAGSTLALTAAAGTAPATAAASCRETPTIVGTTISPKTVMLGVADPKGITVTTKIKANGCSIDRVELGLFGANFIGDYDLHKVGTEDGVTTYDTGLRIAPGDIPNADAGKWSSWVTAWGESTVEAAGPGFKIIRAARVTTNAAPEPGAKGKTITVTGNLTRADWETLSYRGYGKRSVQLQFRTPQGSYRVVKTITGAADGKLKTTVTASADGCYRYVFAGSSTTAKATSKGDCIDVK